MGGGGGGGGGGVTPLMIPSRPAKHSTSMAGSYKTRNGK